MEKKVLDERFELLVDSILYQRRRKFYWVNKRSIKRRGITLGRMEISFIKLVNFFFFVEELYIRFCVYDFVEKKKRKFHRFNIKCCILNIVRQCIGNLIGHGELISHISFYFASFIPFVPVSSGGIKWKMKKAINFSYVCYISLHLRVFM